MIGEPNDRKMQQLLFCGSLFEASKCPSSSVSYRNLFGMFSAVQLFCSEQDGSVICIL